MADTMWRTMRRQYRPGRKVPWEPLELRPVTDVQGRTFLCPWPPFHHAKAVWRTRACPGCVPVTAEQLAAWEVLQPLRGRLQGSAQAGRVAT